jgi:hypothetical protein
MLGVAMKLFQRFLIFSALLGVVLGVSAVSIAAQWEPRPGWRDSYSVDGVCYCDSSNYDHGIGTKTVLAPDGFRRSVKQVCTDIESRFGKGSRDNRIPYNTIACGHGPANDAPDEDLVNGCPGRVDIGNAGCFETGPEWPLAALYGEPMQPLDRSSWSITANVNANSLSALADGNPQTRWSTGTAQKEGQWVEIDFGRLQLVDQIVMNTTASPNDYPRHIRLENHTADGVIENLPFTLEFSGEVTRLTLQPTQLHKIRIIQTGTTDHWYWSIHELHVGYSASE